MSEGNGRLVLAAGGPPHTGLLKKWSTEGWEVYEKKKPGKNGGTISCNQTNRHGTFFMVETTRKGRRVKMIKLASTNEKVRRCGMPECKNIFKVERRER